MIICYDNYQFCDLAGNPIPEEYRLKLIQENYSDDKSPSSREIEHVLGEKMDPDLANMIDSMTGKEAGELLVKLLEP